MTPLQSRLILHRFICQEFGYKDLRDMLDSLDGAPAGFTPNGESEYAQALYLNPTQANVSPEQLSEYDVNIVGHSRKLRITQEDGRAWKSYQYLALLFAEHYLNRYFSDPEKLCADLNMAKAGDHHAAMMPDYEPENLRTIAFQSATGSGKTLLMHAHILQYRHYLGRSGGRLNNVVLLTPNEQMSEQHERELHVSGLRARLFSAETGADLFSHVEIIDLNKLAEKKGVKRVAVQDFGDDNLVLVEKANPDISIEREAGFVQRLFADVDKPNSPVNIVIGARRFIAGWNSWRVSVMGLMHVGVGEGPEIIQMFGRGVRLKGWNMSLKRHRLSGAEIPQDGADLAELETLYIFGLRANYMQAFRSLLEKEGMRVEQETVSLPVTWNFGRKLNLKLIRVKDDRKFELSDERPVLPNPGDTNRPFVTLDLYPRLQSVASGEASSSLDFDKDSAKLEPRHSAFFDKTRIYDRLLARKQQNNWHNLVIRPETVDHLLQDNNWYALYMPEERLAVNDFQSLKELEEIAVDLITEYADQFWRSQRRRWESDRIEVVTLDKNDSNHVRRYDISVEATQDRLIRDIRALKENVRENYFRDLKLGVIMADIHAYQPLLYAGPDCQVTVRPVALNENEKKVIERLKELAESRDPCLQGRELYLIRNLTRGRGVSFFDDFGYYPDFIVWLKDEHCQHVVFLDPKGLGRYGSRERKKVELHSNICEIEKRVRNIDPDLRLGAYVLSVTPVQKIDDGKRSASAWKDDGVYFLNEPDCLKQVIKDVSARSSGLH